MKTTRIKVLLSYLKRTGEGQTTVIKAGTVLDEDAGLAVELITANKARRATPDDEQPKPAPKVTRARGESHAE
jgi:hypothetical protein